MEARPDAKSSIPISAARLYPHVADDEDGTNVPIMAGPMDVTHLVVEVGARVGTLSLVASTHRDDLDPYGVAFDLTPAAAHLLARQLDGTADAVTAYGVDADHS
jgi:hypothetical protein